MKGLGVWVRDSGLNKSVIMKRHYFDLIFNGAPEQKVIKSRSIYVFSLRFWWSLESGLLVQAPFRAAQAYSILSGILILRLNKALESFKTW